MQQPQGQEKKSKVFEIFQKNAPDLLEGIYLGNKEIHELILKADSVTTFMECVNLLYGDFAVEMQYNKELIQAIDKAMVQENIKDIKDIDEENLKQAIQESKKEAEQAEQNDIGSFIDEVSAAISPSFLQSIGNGLKAVWNGLKSIGNKIKSWFTPSVSVSEERIEEDLKSEFGLMSNLDSVSTMSDDRDEKSSFGEKIKNLNLKDNQDLKDNREIDLNGSLISNDGGEDMFGKNFEIFSINND